MSWYSRGTAALVSGSKKVIALSARFNEFVDAGEGFLGPNGVIYEIASIVSATELTLKLAYGGPTNANAAYEIVPVQGYNRELALKAAALLDAHRAVPQEALDHADAAREYKDAAQAARAATESSAATSKAANDAAVAAAAASQTAAKTSETNALASKNAAAASQTAAKTSETNSKASETASAASQVAAKTSETNSKTSETNSKTSETNALASKNAATASQTASKTSETNAKTSETAAAASQAASKTSETAAAASQAASKTSETAAAASQAAAKTSETAAAASQAAAAASQLAAKTSETNSKTSETNALASKNAAATSQTAAATSQTAAKTSETNAKTSETNSKTSETAAAASQAAAGASETAAGASQLAAAASQTAAKTSETNALASKNAASASQTAAKTSETNSKTSETNSKTSETNSKTSETNAAASAAAALTSKNAAAGSQTASKTSETNAAASQLAAKASETTAAASEAAALASKTAAETARAAAVTAKTAAETAQTSAQTAQAGAETAEVNAETAWEGAEAAQAKAETAQGKAETAQAAAVTAKTASETAKTAAEAAKAAASASQTAAKTSETNSKTSETAAAASQLAAKTSETAAAASQLAAKTSETAAAASQLAAKTSETNAAASQAAAKTSETNSKTSETNAAASASAAAASQTAAKTSETNSKASETAALASKTAAGTSQTAAAASQTAAATSATNAATSASAAATSKTGADTARAAAVTAQGKAETAQAAAETAQEAAEDAQAAAEAAQAGANTAKSGADTAKTAAAASQVAAAASQTAAKTSETNSATSAAAALASQGAAKTSETNAATSASAAAASQTAAKTSETNAAASKTAAGTSETNAAASKTAAAASQTAAKTSETNAAASKDAAAISASNAATSEASAAASALAALDSKDAASSSASAASAAQAGVAASAAAAKTSETNAKTSETNAAASKTAAGTSQTSAATSATNAAASATAAATSQGAAATSAAAALVSQGAAKTSETNSKTSETNAAASKTAAGTSQTAAAASATAAGNSQAAAALSESNALASKNAAAASQTAAKTSETNAATSAAAALASEGALATAQTAAKASADAAKVSETNAATSKNAAAASQTSAATSATNAAASATAAKASETKVLDAVAAVENVTADQGALNLSSGVFPTAPLMTSVWTISVAGTVGGVRYEVGDQLYYSARTGVWTHIDNTDKVTAVHGKVGNVTLTPADVGALPSGGTAVAAAKLATAREINGTPFDGTQDVTVSTLYDTDFRRIANPPGGRYTTSATTVTGAITIELPVGMTNTMTRIGVKVYDYLTNNSFEVYFGGYNYGAGSWINTFAYILANPGTQRQFTVRFGKNAAGKAVAYIGELNSVWNYPQVFVTEAQLGYSGQTSAWLSPWGVSFTTTAFENVGSTIANPQIGYASAAATPNALTLRDAAGAIAVSRLTSSVATGTAPFTVTSTTRVANLNVASAGVADAAPWAGITGKPAVIAAGTDAAAARASIGAGTSSLVVGVGAANAKAGNWVPAVSEVTGLTAELDGKAALAGANTFTGANTFNGDVVLKNTTLGTDSITFDGSLAAAMRVSNAYGYVSIAPLNTAYAHIYTDRAAFIFNTAVHAVPGRFSSYNTDLFLQRQSVTKLTLGATSAVFADRVAAPAFDYGYLSAQTVADANGAVTGGLTAKYLTAGAANSPTGQDHSLFTTAYSAAWASQIANDWRTNNWYVRSNNNGAWRPWATVWTSENLGNATTSVAGLMATADKSKLDGIAAGAQVNAVTTVAGRTGAVVLAKTDVGLASVDNTSDAAKPVSTAQQTALNLKANLASPSLTGIPLAPTAPDGTATTQIATTAFVHGAVGGAVSKTMTGGTLVLTAAEASNPIISIAGALTSNAILEIPVTSNRIYSIQNGTTGAFTLSVKQAGKTPTVLVAQGKRNLVFTNSAGAYDAINDFDAIALTGVPTAPTAATTTSTTQIATTAFVQAVNSSDTGSAATALKLKTSRTISASGDATWSTTFDGNANATGVLTLANTGVTAGSYHNVTVDAKGRVTAGASVVTGLVTSTTAAGVTNVATTNTNTFLNVVESVGGAAASTGSSTQVVGAGTVTITSDTAGKITITGAQTITGNAATATKLATARTIGGVAFDGTANINLPGVNATGNQSTTGNAATATKLATARTINGVAFDGSASINITLPETTRLITTSIGNDYHHGGLEVRGEGPRDSIKPVIGFHQPDKYAGSFSMENSTDFFLWMQGRAARGNLYANYLNLSSSMDCTYVGCSGTGSFATVFTSNWFRSTGASGWVNETYGGGIYQDNAYWVNIYAGKSLYVGGEIAAVNNISAYYSDARLKENLRKIDKPLGKIAALTGYHYNANSLGAKYGYDPEKAEVGLLAQDVEKVMPECVEQAPFDRTAIKGESKTGEHYKTLKYERLIPLLIEGIKELETQARAQDQRIETLEHRLSTIEARLCAMCAK